MITGSRIILRDFTVEDAKGNGIKAKGVDQISFINLTVIWPDGPKATNGAYGIYPVVSTNVLIDHVTVSGASDAGIYVGQSKNIVVRHSTAEYNVAGIEIENSMNADVHDNIATHNAGGILVFDLPNLPQMGGHSTRVFNNHVIKNDTPNFAYKGNTVAEVPTGTGIMIMANRNVHVFKNDIGDNQTVNVMIVAYKKPFTSLGYNPLVRDVVVRDNIYGKTGWDPQFPGGGELAKAVGGALPNVMWDGVTGYMSGEETKTEQVRINVVGTPVLKLNLQTATAELALAKPTIGMLPNADHISEPVKVVLPDEQERAAL